MLTLTGLAYQHTVKVNSVNMSIDMCTVNLNSPHSYRHALTLTLTGAYVPVNLNILTEQADIKVNSTVREGDGPVNLNANRPIC